MPLSDEEKELVKQKIKDRRRELWGASTPAPPANSTTDSEQSTDEAESTTSVSQATPQTDTDPIVTAPELQVIQNSQPITNEIKQANDAFETGQPTSVTWWKYALGGVIVMVGLTGVGVLIGYTLAGGY